MSYIVLHWRNHHFNPPFRYRNMSKSLSVTFRLLAELVDAFSSFVSLSGSDKTAWLIDAVRQKVGQPGSPRAGAGGAHGNGSSRADRG